MQRDLWPGPRPQVPLARYVARRRRLAKELGPGRTLLVATHPEALFANDVHHRFRPHSDFWYLTGFGETGAVLLLEGGTGRTVLWLRRRDPRAEIWNGHRLGMERAPDALGVDQAIPIEDLYRTVAREVGGARTKVLGSLDHDPYNRRRIRRALKQEVTDGTPLVAEMRLRKDPDELRMMRKAASVGMAAMEEAAGHIRPGGREHGVEAALLRAYRAAGSEGPGYPPIVGAGANAAILHYVENQGPIHRGDLVLIDAGCTWGHYTCDITRTFPADGRFTERQAALYDLVERARDAAVRQIRPGNTVRAPHEAAGRVLAEGLVEMRYLPGPADQAVRDGTLRAFFMHGTSHYLGLDVHDAGAYKDAQGRPRLLEEGMVLTVEPGLYFNPGFAPCPPGTKGIGIRIEDDVAVTADGHRVLTHALPRHRDAVEALVGG